MVNSLPCPMAEKLLNETRIQCDETRKRNEEEIAIRREAAQKELEEYEGKVAKAQECLNELVSLIDCNRDRFVLECDRVKQALNRYR